MMTDDMQWENNSNDRPRDRIGRDKVSVHLHPNQLPEETRQTVARH